MNQQEEWRPITGFPDYEVSNLGRVASRKSWRGQSFRILKAQVNRTTGYPCVQLYREGPPRVCRPLHTLVTAAFLGERPEGMEVRHLDGNPANSRLTNLCYGTHAENERDKIEHRTHYLRERTECLRGHAFDDENTVRRGPDKTRRACRKCSKVSKRRYEIKRRAARSALREEIAQVAA